MLCKVMSVSNRYRVSEVLSRTLTEDDRIGRENGEVGMEFLQKG